MKPQNHKLPDVLSNGLKIVFCGTAAGDKSAQVGKYYAGPGNKFWKVLFQVGLTPIQLTPCRFEELPQYGIGLTDLNKYHSGMDNKVTFDKSGTEALRDKIMKFQPVILCFNGKRAGKEFFCVKHIEYGFRSERIGTTRLFVAPSTSGAANGFWDIGWWHKLAEEIAKP
jgi:TDG/mug DNA glycosylase family protein